MDVVVISLKSRTDRRENIRGVLDKFFSHANVVFLNALPGGVSGCTKSHLHAIAYLAANASTEFCIVLEDDFFVFTESPSIPYQIANPKANVLMLQANILEMNNDSLQIGCALSSAGYMFRKNYASILLNNIKTSLLMHRPIDVGFTELQKDGSWFAHIVGKQAPGFSDIEKRYVSYHC